MATSLEDCCVVVGVASSALFDLTESHSVFADEGPQAYEKYQDEHLDDPLSPGVAFPFISRLLSFNEIVPNAVDVIVLSKNSPETGMRVMRSVQHHGLAIGKSVFRSGISPFGFMRAFNMSLFLSADADDVAEAVQQGFPAGTVLPHGDEEEDSSNELRIAFDFDAVLADDSADQVYQDAKRADARRAVAAYHEYESEHRAEPLGSGPLKQLLAGLNRLQAAERRQLEPGQTPRLRVSLITARDAPADERAIRTLRSWGLTVDDAFFLGGLDKIPILNTLRPHIYFDDQLNNLDSSERSTPTVHVPFGSMNLPADEQPAPPSADSKPARSMP